MKNLKLILEAKTSTRFNPSKANWYEEDVQRPSAYHSRAFLQWNCGEELLSHLINKYPNYCIRPETHKNVKYNSIRLALWYHESVWGKPWWEIKFYLMTPETRDNQFYGPNMTNLKIDMYITEIYQIAKNISTDLLTHISKNIDVLDYLFSVSNNTDKNVKVELSELLKIKGSKIVKKEMTDGVVKAKIDKNTFTKIRADFNSQKYRLVENTLISIIKAYGERGYNRTGIHLGKSEEYRWDHNISDIYIHDNKPNEIHFNVYWQGDSTDGDEVLSFNDYCASKEQQLKFGREYFWIYRDEIIDVINRLEKIILK